MGRNPDRADAGIKLDRRRTVKNLPAPSVTCSGNVSVPQSEPTGVRNKFGAARAVEAV